MKTCENGIIREMTAEEIAAMQEIAAQESAEERHRELSLAEVQEMLVRQQINTLSVDDQTAYRMRAFYPEWADLAAEGYTAKDKGYKFVYGGELYKTVQDNLTFASSWVPGVGTESLYERIDEQHDGSKYDPIPYSGNMALESGKHYSQDGVLYRCTRDTVNPVYHPLSELVGIYVEVVT